MVEGRGLTLVMVRGDHRVNEIKLQNALGAEFRPAREDEFAQRIGPAGYIGPVGADVPILLDDAVEPGAYVTGANRENAHLRGVEPGRDFPFKRADVRTVEAGDTVGGHPIRIEPAIEVGNIFKLGTRFSEPLGATYLDESGTSRPIWMGSYGLGPARIAAAAVEQYADEQGISWPRSLAPFDVELVGLGREGTEERALAERLYAELRETGLDVIFDDRDAGPGREVRRRRAARRAAAAHGRQAHAGRRRDRGAGPPRPRVALDPAGGRRRRRRRSCGAASRKRRHDGPAGTPREVGQEAAARAQETAEKARLTFRRLSGLDRSGPPPPQTLRRPAAEPRGRSRTRSASSGSRCCPCSSPSRSPRATASAATAVILFAVVALAATTWTGSPRG